MSTTGHSVSSWVYGNTLMTKDLRELKTNFELYSAVLQVNIKSAQRIRRNQICVCNPDDAHIRFYGCFLSFSPAVLASEHFRSLANHF